MKEQGIEDINENAGHELIKEKTVAKGLKKGGFNANQGVKFQNKKNIKKPFVVINEETNGNGVGGAGGEKSNDVLVEGYARQTGGVLTWKRHARTGQHA